MGELILMEADSHYYPQDSIRRDEGVMQFVDCHCKEENVLYNYYYLQAYEF